MSPDKDYAPCPHCAANNITYRQVCWRCGHSLPFSVTLDTRYRSGRDYVARTISRSEIERLLNEAQTLDVEGEKRRKEAEDLDIVSAEPTPDTASRLRVWLWLQRRKEHPSGA